MDYVADDAEGFYKDYPQLQGKKIDHVDDDEIIIRLLFSPRHLNQNGELNNNLFGGLTDGKGCSVLRGCKGLSQSINYVCTQLKKDKCCGLLVAKANEVKAIIDKNKKKPFIVIKTPSKVNPAHADIHGARREKKTEQRYLKHLLNKVFTKPSQDFIDTNQLASFIHPCEASS